MNEDFKYIAAIAEHGSISKAARAMHITQPGLSQRLRRLEEKLDVELFDRSANPMVPTELGRVYVKYAQRAIVAEENMRREMASASAKRQTSLRVGVPMLRACSLLAAPAVEFYESHCGCTLELRELSTLDQLHRLFLGDEIDFAVLSPIMPDPALYDVEFLCREHLVVVAEERMEAPQLREARDGRIGLRQLEGVPFVLPTCGDYFDPLIGHVVDALDVRLDIMVRGCNADLALQLVREGICVGIVPSTALPPRSGLAAYELADVKAGNVLRYIRRNDRAVSDAEALFMDCLRSALKVAVRPEKNIYQN